MRVPDELIEEVLGEVILKFLIPRFTSLKMEATGKWRRGLEVEVRGNTGYIKGFKYTEQLVFGRKPQQKTHEERVKWAFWMTNYVEDFKRWLEVRGLTEYGFQIAYKLDKEGTSWHKKGGSDLLEVLEEDATKDYIYERVGAWYQIRIAEDLKRYLKDKLE